MDYSDHTRKPFHINLRSIFAVEAVVPVLILFLVTFASSANSSFLVLHINDSGVEGLNYYYTISAICLVMFRPLTGALSDKYGTQKILLPCLLIFIAFFLVLSSVNSRWELWLCAVLSAAGFSSAHTLLQSIIMRMTPPERRGAASSSSYIGYDGGTFIGGIINGKIAEKIGYANLFRISAIPVLLAIVILLLWTSAEKQKNK